MPRIVEGRGWPFVCIFTRPEDRHTSNFEVVLVAVVLERFDDSDDFVAISQKPCSTLFFTSFFQATSPRRFSLQLLRRGHACFLYLQV